MATPTDTAPAAEATPLPLSEALAPIAESHRGAWAALARAHAALTVRVQEALTEAGLPPHQWYELLAVIDAAPDGYLKMGDLAEALIMTRGGLTKLFDRLEAAGLVARKACPSDRRAVNAVVEKPGRKLLEQMHPVVARELEESFVSRITAAEAKTIAEALERARTTACAGPPPE